MKPAPILSSVIGMVLLFATIPCHAFDSIADSLEAELKQPHSDTARVRIMLKLGYEWSYRTKTKAEKIAREALTKSREIQFEDGIAGSHSLLGVVYFDRGNLDSALTHYLPSLDHWLRTGKELKAMKVYASIAMVHHHRNAFEDAWKNYQRSKEIADRLGSDRDKGNAHNHLASYWINLGYFTLDVEKEIFAYRQHFKKSIPHLDTAISYFNKAGHEKGVAMAYGNMAISELHVGDTVSSLNHSFQALAVFEKLDYKVYSVISYAQIGRTYKAWKKYDLAEQNLLKSLELAREMESKFDIRNACELLSSLHEEQGNYEKALFYKREYHDVEHELLNLENQAEMNRLQQEFEKDKREQELTMKEERLAQTNDLLLVALAAAGLLLVFALLLIRTNIQRTRVNKKLLVNQNELQTKNKVIEQNRDLLENQNHVIEEKNAKITEQHRQLQRLYDDQRHLLAVVAHDLRGPIDKIQGLSHLLAVEKGLSEDQLEILQRIAEQTDAGKRLVNDLTSLNYYESDKVEINWEQLDMVTKLSSIVQGFDNNAREKNIAIKVNVSPGLEPVVTDSAFFTRILDNLLSNALKFSESGKTVWINAKRVDERFVVSVRDQGPGLSEEEAKLIFRKFHRLTPQPTAGEPSTGLGLSIVKVLSELLQGTIEVESQPGIGSTFRLMLPLLPKGVMAEPVTEEV